MHRIVIVGAGKIGAAIAKMLDKSGDSNDNPSYQVTIVDTNMAALDKFRFDDSNITTSGLHIGSPEFVKLLSENDAVLSACPYTANVQIATAALEAGCSYFDLTEDRYTTEAIMDIAKAAKPGQAFMPQCGLAPGFIGILGNDVQRSLDNDGNINLQMRVGALPTNPNNRLGYNLTWSTVGLVNEYCNPCQAVVNHSTVDVVGLEGLEDFILDGVKYEAFNTSGGLGTLCETLFDRVANVNYKTVRYPGHCELMRFLLEDMGFHYNKHDLVKLLDNVIPTTGNDVVIAGAFATGKRDGVLTSVDRMFKVPAQVMYDEWWTAIQVTTASGACAVVDLCLNDKSWTGFIKQESVELSRFLSNRFGKNYLTK